MNGRSIARRSSAITLLLLLGTACQDPVEPTPDTAPAPRQASLSPYGPDAAPFRMVGEARFVSQEFAPGFPAERSDFGGRCSVPSDYVARFAVTAEATHLGHLTADYEHCGHIDFQTGKSTDTDGHAVITAANGDQLWAAYRTADVPVGDFGTQVVFHGGTGRFQNASGEAIARVVCDRAAGTCTYDSMGTLVYDASDRAGS